MGAFRLNHNWTLASLGTLNPDAYTPEVLIERCERGFKAQFEHEGHASFSDGAYVIPPPSSHTSVDTIANYLRTHELQLSSDTIIRYNTRTEKWRSVQKILEQRSQIEYESHNPNFKIMLFAIQVYSAIITPRVLGQSISEQISCPCRIFQLLTSSMKFVELQKLTTYLMQ